MIYLQLFLFYSQTIAAMLLASAAEAARVVTDNPIKFLGGLYHPSLLETIEKAKASSTSGAPIDGEALTVALDVVQAWAVLLTLGFTLVIFIFLAFCICSKKDDGYVLNLPTNTALILMFVCLKIRRI